MFQSLPKDDMHKSRSAIILINIWLQGWQETIIGALGKQAEDQNRHDTGNQDQ